MWHAEITHAIRETNVMLAAGHVREQMSAIIADFARTARGTP